MAMTGQQTRAPAPMPILYSKPVPLTRARHGKTSYTAPKNFSFAAHINSVPVHIGEFALLVRHYPIVFTSAAPAGAVAVLGIAAKQNLFVDAQGRWKEGTYIPAYIRRYPFILQDNTAEKRLSLCIDESANATGAGGEPFFVDGDISGITRRALAFCEEFRTMMDLSRTFGEFLEKDGVLVEKNAEFTLPKGVKHRLNEFRMIDEAKFDALSDKRILQYRKQKFLHPAYLHMVSINNWPILSELASKRA